MQRISKEAKEIIVKKALNRGDDSLASIANANGVGKSTLDNWLRCYRKDAVVLCNAAKSGVNTGFSKPEKFNHLMNTAHLDEISTGAYCRKHGLYNHQLQQWRASFMNIDEPKKEAYNKAKLKKLEVENKKLKHDLRRKEKALAEASALLVMKKKATLIWGGAEDD